MLLLDPPGPVNISLLMQMTSMQEKSFIEVTICQEPSGGLELSWIALPLRILL